MNVMKNPLKMKGIRPTSDCGMNQDMLFALSFFSLWLSLALFLFKHIKLLFIKKKKTNTILFCFSHLQQLEFSSSITLCYPCLRNNNANFSALPNSKLKLQFKSKECSILDFFFLSYNCHIARHKDIDISTFYNYFLSPQF